MKDVRVQSQEEEQVCFGWASFYFTSFISLTYSSFLPASCFFWSWISFLLFFIYSPVVCSLLLCSSSLTSSQLVCPQASIFWQLSDNQKRADRPELWDASVCVCVCTQHGVIHSCTGVSINGCNVILKVFFLWFLSQKYMSTVLFLLSEQFISIIHAFFVHLPLLCLDTLNQFSLFSQILIRKWHDPNLYQNKTNLHYFLYQIRNIVQ